MTKPHHYAGLDAVRVLAIAFVTLQHVFTLLKHDDWTMIGGISIGQYGVAIFLFISGFLASVSRRPPLAWLAQRLARLMPAYWIVMAASFTLAAAAGHKRFDTSQVLSQMAGLGFWTYRENLVNSPTWFVSVVLVCYLVTFLARLLKVQLVATAVALAVLMAFALTEEMPRLSVVYFTYALGSLLAMVPALCSRRALLAMTLAFGVLGFCTHREFLAVSCAVGVVAAAFELQRVPACITLCAKFTYEYFLVHGVLLYGAIQKLPENPVLAVAVGIAAGAVAAVALQWLTEWLLKLLSRDPDPLARHSRKSGAPQHHGEPGA